MLTFQFQKVRLKVADIEDKISDAQMQFQFQKVRLKELKNCGVRVYFLVSIPKGSIKSWEKVENRLLTCSFNSKRFD